MIQELVEMKEILEEMRDVRDTDLSVGQQKQIMYMAIEMYKRLRELKSIIGDRETEVYKENKELYKQVALLMLKKGFGIDYE